MYKIFGKVSKYTIIPLNKTCILSLHLSLKPTFPIRQGYTASNVTRSSRLSVTNSIMSPLFFILLIKVSEIHSSNTKEVLVQTNFSFVFPIISLCTLDVGSRGIDVGRSVGRSGQIGEGMDIKLVYLFTIADEIVFPSMSTNSGVGESKLRGEERGREGSLRTFFSLMYGPS